MIKHTRIAHLRLVFLVLTVAAVPAALTRAVDTTWTFNGDGNWNEAAKWDNGEPVNNTFDVFIDDGDSAVTVLLNVIRSINDLTIGSDDTLSLNNGQDLTIFGASVANDGVIQMNSTGSGTDLRIDGATTTLSGGGSLVLGGHANNRIFGNASGLEILVNSGSHTIQGGGSFSAIKVTNQNLVDANSTGDTLSFAANSPITNTGTLRASGGGTLSLDTTVTNTGGSIEAQAGSVVALPGSANIVGGTLTTQDDGVIRATSGAPTINGVTIDGLFQINNSVDVNFVGMITNNMSSIEQNSSGSDTDVRISGDVTVTGPGKWKMSDHANNRVFGPSGVEVLTNDTNHTIEGAGTIFQLGSLVNKGTIDANQPISLSILSNAPVTNTGTLRATGDGTLSLNATVTNTGGSIEAQAGSVVALPGSANIVGGTLTTQGDGAIQATSGAPTINGVTIDGLFQINNSADPIFVGIITNNTGTIEQNSSGSDTDVQISGNVTVTGAGTWQMSNHANNRVFGPSGLEVLTNDTNHTIKGAGTILQLGGLVNKGTINANQSIPLTIQSNAPVTNSGTLKASGGATLRLQSALVNTGGIIQAEDASTVEIAGSGAVMDGATFQTSGSGVVLLAGGGLPTLKDVTINGLVRLPNSQDVKFEGTITNNTNTFEQNSSGSDTDVQIGGNVTVTGPGTWRMSDDVHNRVFGPVGSEVLTNDTGHTIAGAGTILQLGGLVNKGTINANQPIPLTIQSNAPVTNSGTLKASAGATLRLQSALVNNGGIIQAEDTSTVEIASSGAVMDAVTFQTAGSGVVLLAGGGLPTLRDVTINGLVRLPNSQDAKFEGTITNNTNTFEQNSSGSDTDVQISGDVTVTGSGSWKMSNHANNRVFGPSGSEVLTNDTGHTIAGAGTILQLGGLVNKGTINANQPIPLTIQSNAPVTNSGTLKASAGATLRLQSALVNNGGIIQAEDTSTVEIASSGAVMDAVTFQTAGSGVVLLSGGGLPTLRDVTINGLVRLPNSQDAKFEGTITNNTNTFEQNSSGSDTDVVISGDVTVTGPGSWKMSSHANNRVFGPVGSEVLTNDTNHTIAGAGTILQLGGLVNKGTINANQPIPLTIQSNAPVTNSGTLKASAGATLRLQSALVNNGGIIQAEDTSTVEIASSGAVMDAVTFQTSGSGVVLLAGGGLPTLRDVTINGLVRLPNSQDAKFEGTITNNTNTFEQNSSGSDTDVQISGDVTVTGPGTWRMTNNANNRAFGPSGAEVLTNDTGHTIEGAGSFSNMGLVNRGLIHANQPTRISVTPSNVNVDGSGADVLNETGGVLRASGAGGLLLGSGTFVNRNGGVIILESTVALSGGAVLENQPGGIVRGDGTLDVATGDFTNGGTVAPGFSSAILTVLGDYPQTASGELEIEIDGTLVGEQYDQLAVDGDVTLDGLLTVLPGFTPRFEDSFTVVDATASTSNLITGVFSNTPGNVLTIPEGTFDVLYNPQTVVLTHFVIIPEPGAIVLAVIGLVALLGYGWSTRRR